MQVIYQQDRPGFLGGLLKAATGMVLGNAIGDMFGSSDMANAAKATDKATAASSLTSGKKLSGLLPQFTSALTSGNQQQVNSILPQIHALGGTNINAQTTPEQLGLISNNLNNAMSQWQTIPTQKGTYRGGSWVSPTPFSSIWQ